MNIQIQSIHLPSSEVLNERIKQKLHKSFGHYPYITKGSVFLKFQENEKEKKNIMEVRLFLPQGDLFAETKDTNLYKALDRNVDKLKRQLEKYKKKMHISL